MTKPRRKSRPLRVITPAQLRYGGGWVAPLQGAQFAGLSGAVGPDANGDNGTDSGSGDGGGSV